MIWQFRKRTEPFSTSDINHDDDNAEMRFCKALHSWSDELLSGNVMATSTLEKKYNKSTYKHLQFEGRFKRTNLDDYFSPVQPQRYIDLRIVPTMEFYQRRLPAYYRRRFLLQLLLLSSVIATAVLSHYKYDIYMVNIN